MTTRKRITHALASLLVLIGLVGTADAALVATDLNTGGTDVGFSGGWAGSGNVFIKTASDLAYANYFITQTGTTARIYAVNIAHGDRQDSRALAAAMSNEVWFSVLVNVPSGGSFAGLALFTSVPSPTYSHAGADVRVLLSDSQLIVDLDGGTLPAGTGSYAAGTDHLLLGQMNVVAGNDTISVWVDPNLNGVTDPGDLPAADYTNTTVDFSDSIGAIGVPGSIGTASEVYMDAIWLSDTTNAFKDVTGVTGAADADPPTISALSPTNGASGVAVDTNLVITFSEPVTNAASGNIVIQQTAGGTFETIPVTSSNITISGADVTINPTGDLANITGYYVEIDSGAIEDPSGNDFAGISGSSTWSFVTEILDVTAPAISSLSPVNGATGVALGTDLVITFDEDVQKGTSGNIVIQQSAGGTFETIAVTSPNVTVSGADVTINPSSDFTKGAGYYVEIDSGAIEDLAGNDFTGISGSGTWSFQTSAGALVAADFNTDGIDTGFAGGWAGSGNVGIKDAPDLTYANYGITQSGTTERVYFSNTGHGDRQDSRALAAAVSNEVWFSILVNVPSGGSFAGLALFTAVPSPTYSHAGADVRVLMSDTELIVDLDGGTLPSGTGSFAAGTTHLLLGQLDVVAGNDTISVWVDPNLNGVTDQGDLPAANYISTTVDFTDSIGAVGVPGSVGTASEVYMDAIWLSNTSNAFKDVTGASGEADTTPPTVTSLSPINGATDVAVDTGLLISFSEFVTNGATGSIVIQQTAGGTFETIPITSTNVTVTGTDVFINPSNDLANSTGYYVDIDAGAFTDLADTPNDFAGISGPGTWSFTTVDLDVTAPTITALSPTNGATGVSADSELMITFDEDVQKGTSGNIVIQQSAGGTFESIPVNSPSVSVSGATVTIGPSGLLAKGAGYYVEIDSGAIRDLIGNPFAGISGNSTWAFQINPGLLAATDLNAGGVDTGFSDGFYNGSNNVFPEDAPDLAYVNYGIVQTGTTQRVYASNAGPDRQDLRNLEAAMSGEIWFSVLVHVPTGEQYAGLTFNNYGNSYDPITTAARVLMTTDQLRVGFNGGSATIGATNLAADTTHLLLGQMMVAPGDDTLNVWVDPNLTYVSGPGSLPAAEFSSTETDFADSISVIGVAGRAGGGGKTYLDAIWLSDTDTAFYDVTGVGSGIRPTLLIVR